MFDSRYAPSTVNTYVSAMGYSHKLMAFPDPTKVFFVSQMIKGYGKIGFRFGKLCFIVSFMAFEPPKFLFGVIPL